MPIVKVTKKQLWKTIRDKRLECCGLSHAAVEFCTCPRCPNYRFRFGRPPKETDYVFQPGDENVELTDMREAHARRLQASNETRKKGGRGRVVGRSDDARRGSRRSTPPTQSRAEMAHVSTSDTEGG